MTKRQLFTSLALCGAIFVGCSKRSDRSSPASRPALSSHQGVASQSASLTRDECLRWANEVEKTMSVRDANFLSESVDLDRLAERSLAGIGIPLEYRKAFVASLRASEGLFSIVARDIEPGTRYRLLRLDANEGGAIALFRAYYSGTLIYHEFCLARGRAGEVCVADAYVFNTGALLSETLQGMALPFREQIQQLSDGGRMPESPWLQAARTMREMATLVQEGKGRQAMDLYGRLPKELQATRGVWLVRLQAAEQSGEDEYTAALAEFCKRFPGDPAADLMGIALLYRQGKFDEAIRTADSLEKRVGKDPALDLIRCSCHIEAGRLEEAKACAFRVTETEPDLEEAWRWRVDISLRQKDFAETVRLLAAMENQSGDPIGDLEAVQGYGEFVQSPEYKAWMRSRAAATQPR